MTKINEQQSKEIFELWCEGNLTKAEVGERFGVSEDVVKYHIKLWQARTRPPDEAQEQAPEQAAAVSEEGLQDASPGALKGFLRDLIGIGDKDQIIELLTAKIDDLTASAHAQKPVQRDPLRQKRYVCAADSLLLQDPAAILSQGQRLISRDTEGFIRAVAEGTLIPADAPEAVDSEPCAAGFAALKAQVEGAFKDYYKIAAPCTRDKITRFVAWFRSTESSTLSDHAVREIAMEIVLKTREERA